MASLVPAGGLGHITDWMSQMIYQRTLKESIRAVGVGLHSGDKVELRERSRQLAIVLEANQLAERDVPDYIEVDHGKQSATYVRVPALADVPYPVQMEPNLVVEFYSR